MANRIEGDVIIEGSLSVGGALPIPAGSVDDTSFSGSNPLTVEKQEHLYKPSTSFDLAIGGTPVAYESVVFVASTAGVIRGFHCMLNDTGTTTDVDFDVKINGTTALSAAVNITNADADKLIKDGTISTPTLAADDVVSIEIAVTTSTGAQGPFAWVEIDEIAAAG